MAGGMTGGGWGRGGLGIPLAERVRTDEPSPARHCWVVDAVDGRSGRRPGLLVEWRQVTAGWEGRVVYSAPGRAQVWAVVEEWLPADRLTPL